MKNKNKLKKQLKHKKQQQAFKERIDDEAVKRTEYHGVSILQAIPYFPFAKDAEMLPSRQAIIQSPNHPLNQNSEKFMAPVREFLQRTDREDLDSKDNRFRLTKQQYQPSPYGDGLFSGIVTQVKQTTKNRNIRTYILVEEVQGLVKSSKQSWGRWKLLTDHLWLDVNDFMVAEGKAHVEVAIGDMLTFAASICSYRGLRENIEQTKYGVKDVVMITSGYPMKKKGPGDSKMMGYDFMHPIMYPHHNHYIFKMYSAFEYRFSQPTFGDQANPDAVNKSFNPYYQLGNSYNIDMYGQLKYGFYKINEPASLVFDKENLKSDTDAPLLHWTHNPNIDPEKQIIALTYEDLLPKTDFDTMYNRIVEKLKCRKTSFGQSKHNRPHTHSSKPSLNTKIFKALHTKH